MSKNSSTFESLAALNPNQLTESEGIELSPIQEGEQTYLVTAQQLKEIMDQTWSQAVQIITEQLIKVITEKKETGGFPNLNKNQLLKALNALEYTSELIVNSK